MSTVVASYTPVCRSPVLPASRSWRSAAAAFPTSVTVKCRRLPLLVTCALPEKQRPVFSIPPTALLHPVPPHGKERWDIKEEEDHVKLWFQVPGLSEEDLDITAGDDMLEIKRKGARAAVYDGDEAPATDEHGVGSFHVRLLMTKEYDANNVTAELKAGMLEVTVGKSRNRRFNRVGFGPRSPAQTPNSPVTGPTQGRTPNTSPNQTQLYSVQRAAGPKGAQDGVGLDKNQEGLAQTKLPKEENRSR